MIIQGRLDETKPVFQVSVISGIVEKLEFNASRFEKPDVDECLILSPLLDPQVNGGLQVSFTSPGEPGKYGQVLEKARRHGISHFLPTVITTGRENLRDCLKALTQWREGDHRVSQAVPGFHLEGPGISPEDGFRGAHALQSVRTWTETEYHQCQESCHGLVKMVTLAPETLHDFQVVETMVREGVVVAIGHTKATRDRLEMAVDAGAALFTHWGNGITRKMDRHDNPLWPALADKRLGLSIIADGHHLPDSMVQVAYLCKTAGNLVLTADTGPLAGALPGLYDLWDSKIRVRDDGRLTVEDSGYLAGSGVWLDTCLLNVRRVISCDIHSAWRMASLNIRNLLGMPEWNLKLGMKAEMTLVRYGENEEILGCFVGGEWTPYSPNVS